MIRQLQARPAEIRKDLIPLADAIVPIIRRLLADPHVTITPNALPSQTPVPWNVQARSRKQTGKKEKLENK